MAALLRRAFPPPLPLATRSAASSSSSHVLFSRLITSRNLPFSTSSGNSQIPDKSPEIAYLNTVEKLKEDFASSSVELRLPSRYPFDVSVWGNTVRMGRSHETKEIVEINFNGEDSIAQIDARIVTDKVGLLAKMSAKPDELNIHEVIASDPDGKMGDYKEYLQTKGVTTEMISFLYQLVGFN